MLLDKIYRHQRVPFLALVLVVTRVRSSTLPHPFPDLNPILLFGIILHAPPSTWFTAFLAVNVANFTSVKRADVYLTDLLNTFVPWCRVPMMLTSSSHFNTANHSISDIKICAISPFSGGNDSRKRQFLLFDPFIVSIFVQHVRTKVVTSHLFTPLFMFIHLPLIYFAPPPRLLIDFKNSKWLDLFLHLIMHL